MKHTALKVHRIVIQLHDAKVQFVVQPNVDAAAERTGKTRLVIRRRGEDYASALRARAGLVPACSRDAETGQRIAERLKTPRLTLSLTWTPPSTL